MLLEQLVDILSYSFATSTPIAFLAVGESLLQRTGRVNLGLEGYLALGASVAVVTSVYTKRPDIAVAIAALACALFSLLYIALTIRLEFNQFAAGLLLGFLGLGLADIISRIPDKPIGIPMEPGSMLHRSLQVLPVILAIIITLILSKTWIGIEIRAIGYDSSIAKERGLRVTMLRSTTAIISGLLSGIAGAYLSLSVYGGKYWMGVTGGMGWIALGCVILGYWNPVGAVLAAYLIGSLKASRPYLDDIGLPGWIADISPYIATVVVLCMVGLFLKLRPELRPPKFEA